MCVIFFLLGQIKSDNLEKTIAVERTLIFSCLVFLLFFTIHGYIQQSNHYMMELGRFIYVCPMKGSEPDKQVKVLLICFTKKPQKNKNKWFYYNTAKILCLLFSEIKQKNLLGLHESIDVLPPTTLQPVRQLHHS